MGHWVEFKRDYDHYWKSGARTAYKKGMVLFIKDEVKDAAGDAIKETKKPEGGHAVIPEGTQASKTPRGAPTLPAFDGNPDGPEIKHD